MVRNIRNIRLDEFIDYQRRLQDDVVEVGAEEFASEDYNLIHLPRLTQYNEMIEKYCKVKYPKDLNKRRALMENIIYGKIYIPIRELRGL
jgi:hypothetical protein